MNLNPGTRVDKYEIKQRLGVGGMADVFQATDTTFGRDVALKILPPEFARDPERVTRFDKEVRASAALSHPNIVQVHDVGDFQYEGIILKYYVMALLPGGDLKEKIRNGLGESQCLQVLLQISYALGHAHEAGFVHRDLKPENILFDSEDNAVLTDLGIAKAIGAGTKMTKTGMSIGTPHYMSPEQARGRELDGRSDLYSLGVVFYEMLTGKVPYDAEDTFAVGLSHINDPVPFLSEPYKKYQFIVDRLMAKLPDERYQNTIALIKDIENLQAGELPPQSKYEPQLAQRNATKTYDGWNDSKPHSAKTSGGFKWGLGGLGLVAVLAIFLVNIAVKEPEKRDAVQRASPADVLATSSASSRVVNTAPREQSASIRSDATRIVSGSSALQSGRDESGLRVNIGGNPFSWTQAQWLQVLFDQNYLFCEFSDGSSTDSLMGLEKETFGFDSLCHATIPNESDRMQYSERKVSVSRIGDSQDYLIVLTVTGYAARSWEKLLFYRQNSQGSGFVAIAYGNFPQISSSGHELTIEQSNLLGTTCCPDKVVTSKFLVSLDGIHLQKRQSRPTEWYIENAQERSLAQRVVQLSDEISSIVLSDDRSVNRKLDEIQRLQGQAPQSLYQTVAVALSVSVCGRLYTFNTYLQGLNAQLETSSPRQLPFSSASSNGSASCSIGVYFEIEQYLFDRLDTSNYVVSNRSVGR